MNHKFFERIENPSSYTIQKLRDSAIKNVESQLGQLEIDKVDTKTIENLSFSYYFDWDTDNPSVMFIIDKPGDLRSDYIQEINLINDLPNNDKPLSLIDIYRKFAMKRFSRRYPDFTSSFLSNCNHRNLINVTQEWVDYLFSENFFNDFYLTELIKYRAPWRTVGTEEILTSISQQLFREIQFIDPKIIFTIGYRVWKSIKWELQALPVDEADFDNSKMTQVHGHLHKAKRVSDTYIIPLSHMSGQAFGGELSKTEYMDRMDEGLKKYKIKSTS